jgi:biopolymer transport protein ExbD
VLDVPTNTATGGMRDNPIPLDDARSRMIFVQLRKEAGQAKFVVEDSAVARGDLEAVLKRLAKETHKSELLLDAQGVDWGSVVAVIDAASGAKLKKVHFKVQPPAVGPAAF